MGRIYTRALAFLLSSASATILIGCRKDVPPPTDVDSAVSSPDDAGEASGEDAEAHPLRSTETRAEEARHDAGATPRACEGRVGEPLLLLASALDERCAITEAEWHALADGGVVNEDADAGDGGGGEALRQEARRDADGDHVVLSLTNRGKMPVVVPLRFNVEHPEQAVSVLAEDAHHALFELSSPTLDMPAIKDAGSKAVRQQRPMRHSTLVAIDAGLERRAFVHVHSARIRLLPGASATLRLAIDPTITRRLDKPCDGGCPPLHGHVTLHVGQLIADADVGLPAVLAWDVK